MHPVLSTLLALVLAHLLADFPLQSDWIARNKGKRPWALIIHIAIHYATAWVCLKLFTAIPYLSVFNQTIVVAYFVTHLLIDITKSRITAHKQKWDNGKLFLADQLAHILTVAITTVLLTRAHFSWFPGWVANLTAIAKFHVLVTATVYAGSVFGGGHLIRYFTKSLASNLSPEATGGETQEEIKNAGLYIGWIERFLVITAIAMQSPALVGLILTGKSIARFPELKDARFAEYFLIGTLMSISVAVAGGIILTRLLYGTISLK